MAPRKPNILLVLADQLRASSVGYAGEEPVITPHLDRLAKESAVLSIRTRSSGRSRNTHRGEWPGNCSVSALARASASTSG